MRPASRLTADLKRDGQTSVLREGESVVIEGERPTWLGSLSTNMEGGRMSIVVRFHPTNATKEQYDESLRRMEEAGIWPNPPGLEVHVAFGPDDDLRASEIWSSREQFEAYGEKLMPILSDMGIEFSAEPEIFEVQNLVK